MSNFSPFPLQQAIYQALSGDVTLMALVEGIFDHTPQNTPYPYVTLGDMKVSDWSSKTTTGTEENFTLHVWSREGGRKQAIAIMERIHTLLHNVNLTVTGHTLVLLQFISGGVALENDGWTYNGVLHFRALLHSN